MESKIAPTTEYTKLRAGGIPTSPFVYRSALGGENGSCQEARMSRPKVCRVGRTVVSGLSYLLVCAALSGQGPSRFEPTLESLDQHPLPAWYADAKLGIFVHWGFYSVPGRAPLVHPNHDFATPDYLMNNPTRSGI